MCVPSPNKVTKILWNKSWQDALKLLQVHLRETGMYQILWQSIQQLLRHFTKIQNCQPAGDATGKVRGSPKSLGFILWGS